MVHCAHSLLIPAVLVSTSWTSPCASEPGAAQDDPPSRALLVELTSQARLAGTSGSLRAAQFVARTLEAAGWKVEIDEREVLLSLPRRIEFRVFADADADEPFFERVERFDADAVPAGDVPHYSAWSASGRVRGPVIDVGRGLRADYERLGDAGVVLSGAVALARYGGAYRGVKADLAEEYGCAALLLFSDPAEDGDVRGPTWPTGPWKPDWAAQRGSISPIALAPGDPSTPGFGSPPRGEPATPGFGSPRTGERAERLSREEVDSRLPHVLCIPIGVRDVRKLWERMQSAEDDAGDDAGAWKPIGPGPVEVELALDLPRELRTIRNVVARLPGSDEKLVIAGNHRDAWVRGAHDAGSGTVSLLRAAQRLGESARGGWQPLHTIVLGFWDAEEFGLIGSTEWGEANAERLRRDGLVYVNADAVVDGTHFGASAAPGLIAALRSALARVPAPVSIEPDAPRTLDEQWTSRASPEEIGLPGSGSDFAVFLHHLSMPVLDIGFGGNAAGGYHTSFDDVALVERYLDPGYVGHELAGRFVAELLARFADDPRGGFDDAEAARAFAARARAAAEKRADGTAWLSTERAERLARAFDALAATASELASVPAERFLAGLEVKAGLEGRAWFKNQLWTPGLESGYGSETWPRLRAAALRGDADLDRAVDALVSDVESLRKRWLDGAASSARPESSAAGH
jgi:N-acetylated-alpha-linked acidic dipeptidase